MARHRKALDDWITHTAAKARMRKPGEVYLNYNRNEVFEKNVELMHRWSKEKPMQP